MNGGRSRKSSRFSEMASRPTWARSAARSALFGLVGGDELIVDLRRMGAARTCTRRKLSWLWSKKKSRYSAREYDSVITRQESLRLPRCRRTEPK